MSRLHALLLPSIVTLLGCPSDDEHNARNDATSDETPSNDDVGDVSETVDVIAEEEVSEVEDVAVTTEVEDVAVATEVEDVAVTTEVEDIIEVAANRSPQVAGVRVVGASVCAPFTCEVAEISDPDDDELTIDYVWTVAGAVVASAHEPTLPVGHAVAADSIECSVTASDGAASASAASAPVTAVDLEPVVVFHTDTHARAGDVLTCSVDVSDDCDDAPAVVLGWSINDTIQEGVTDAELSTDGLATGDLVACVATVDDGAQVTTSASDAVLIASSRLTIDAAIANGRAGTALAVIDDLDGDELAEIAIGAPNTSFPNATQAGGIYVVMGREDVDVISLDDVVAGVGGHFIPGDRGNFDVALMACGPAFYVGGCPKYRDVGELTADIEGPAGAGLGFGLAYAGDLDGDGVGDLVASAPYELIGDLWRGRSYVMSGDSLLGDPLADAALGGGGFIFDGECGRRRGLDLKMSSEFVSKAANGDLAGYRAVGLGDMNGDGLGDYAVSAPNHGDRDEGTIYVIFGRDDGLGVAGDDIYQRGCGLDQRAVPGVASGVAGVAVYGPDKPPANAFPIRWGIRLAPAGDFNGDGFDDVLVPSPGLGSGVNSAFVILGKRYPTPIALVGHQLATHWEIYLGDFSIVNGVQKGRFGAGFPAGGGGDVNGDGFDDLVFAAIDFDRKTFLNVLFGRASDDDGILRTEESVDGSGRGFAVAGTVDMASEVGVAGVLGDFNGDGFDDVVFGSPNHGNPDVGGVFVVFGAATAPNVTLSDLRAGIGGFTIEGTVSGEAMGAALDAGDVDGDGLDDLVIGVPRAAGAGGEASAGRVIVSYGRDLSGAIAEYGGPGDDEITGSENAESSVGGRGDDVIDGGGGADVLYGGAGDDVLIVGDGGFRRVRGGSGDDTLVLNEGVPGLDLTALRGRVRTIERLRLSGQNVSLSAREVVRLSDTDNRLIVDGTGTVQTNAADRWLATGTAIENGHEFVTLADGQARLWLGRDLATVIPPTILEGRREVPENSEVGDVVATLGAVDPDGDGAALRWELTADPSAAFALDGVTGELSIVDATPLDFETVTGSWALAVRVTDEDGLDSEGMFEVALVDVAEPPHFVTLAANFGAEEDARGVLGQVVAIDPDADDVVAYSLTSDASGLFEVDAVTGDVALREVAALDFETATRHVVTVTATDASGLTDSEDVTITVLDRDVIERDTRVTFDLRDWSIWDDSTSSYFDGFQIDGLTDDQVAVECVSQAPGDEKGSETWLAFVPGLFGALSVAIDFVSEYRGKICTHNTLIYDEGTFNATMPVDIHLEIPDEIHAGESIRIGSSATPNAEGAAFWGRTTGISMAWKVELQDFGVYLAICEKVITNKCVVAVDKSGLNGSKSDKWESVPKTWTAGQLDDPDQFVLLTPEQVTADTLKLAINWDEYIFTLLTLLGIPSNKGRIETVLEGAGGAADKDVTIRFDYTILATQVGFEADNAWAFFLTYRGVDARLTFENGDIVTFRVGTPFDVTVPQNGDVNGDGRVDVRLDFTLDSEFTNRWEHREGAGYIYTGGFGRLRALDDNGYILGQRQVGPAIENFCAPKVTGQTVVPLKCYASGGVDTYKFRPTGFSTPTLLGGLDLSSP